MFDADVPADWCSLPNSLPPVSLPSWLKPQAPSAPESVKPATVAPTIPPGADPPRVANAAQAKGEELPPPPSLPRPRPVAVEVAPVSVPSPSRRSVTITGVDPAEVEKLHAALIEAIAVGLRARREALAAAERDLVHLALAIAGKVVGREVAQDPSVVASWAREGIAALGEQDQVVVAISPDLAERLPPESWARGLDGVVPVVDRALPPGGCEVRGSYGRVDAGLGPRLASVADTLEDALPGAGSEAA